MSSYWEAQQQEGTPDPIEEEIGWADIVGISEAHDGPPVGPEGKAALAHENPLVRAAFIQSYWEGFLNRKVNDGDISDAEWHFYNPYPGRWGAYWEDPHG